MKLRVVFQAAVLAALACQANAEISAPAVLAGNSAIVVIATGTGRLPVTSGYRITFAASSIAYAISPISGSVPTSVGTYAYQKPAPIARA
jgi:hypothetical protein